MVGQKLLHGRWSQSVASAHARQDRPHGQVHTAKVATRMFDQLSLFLGIFLLSA